MIYNLKRYKSLIPCVAFFGKLLFYCSCLLFANSLFAQNFTSAYFQYTIKNGLPENLINDISQDSKGIIWIATKKNLTRFDGSNFINFSSATSPTFFKHNEIDKFYEHKNMLYLLSRKDGLIQLNTKTTEFKHVFFTGIESMDIVGDTTVYLFNKGLLEVRIKNRIVAQRSFSSGLKGSVIINNSKIYCLLPEKRLSLLDFKLDKQKQLKLPLMGQSGKIMHSKKYGVIYQPGDSVYVINNNDHFRVHPELLDKNNVNYFREEKNGKPLFIQSSTIPHYIRRGDFIKHLFEGNKNWELRMLLKLNENSYILGTNQGLIVLAYQPKASNILNDYEPPNNDFIRVRRKIIEDKNGDLYFLGYPGLAHLKNNAIQLLNTEKISSYDGILIKNKLYFTSEGSGFYSYSTTTGKIKKYITKDLTAKENLYHVSIYQDTMLLIAGRNKMVLFDMKSEQTKAFKLDDNIEIYSVVYQKEKNQYWAGTNKGLYLFSLDYYNGIKKKKTTFSHLNITKDILLLPEKNQIWLATSEGLFIRDLKTIRLLKIYNNKKTISHPVVTAMVKDKNEIVWVSTYYGITTYNLKTGGIQTITPLQEIKNNEYNSI
jgi:hypothetical protein